MSFTLTYSKRVLDVQLNTLKWWCTVYFSAYMSAIVKLLNVQTTPEERLVFPGPLFEIIKGDSPKFVVKQNTYFKQLEGLSVNVQVSSDGNIDAFIAGQKELINLISKIKRVQEYEKEVGKSESHEHYQEQIEAFHAEQFKIINKIGPVSPEHMETAINVWTTHRDQFGPLDPTFFY